MKLTDTDKEDIKSLHELKLHETCWILDKVHGNYIYSVMRVEGGWLYQSALGTTLSFVPYSTEFLNKLENSEIS